ncbi:MAG TPA: NAD(P)H-hydrate dehydratase [Microvirga sp.]|jgi:hydroxyethylthiazole kinase-like uncharacterized protein yjeF|nr:NAD(P)H-hydrate dehydratase [Microvirga sp.]
MTFVITTASLSSNPLPEPDAEGDKNQRGRVLVIAGSASGPGGALLAGTPALRAGAGKLQVATVDRVALPLGLALPETLVVALPETPDGDIAPASADLLLERVTKCDAILIGPGMLDHDVAAELTGRLQECEPGPAFVLDAAPLVGLMALRDRVARHGGRVVITPHAGEMAGLLGIDKQAIGSNPYHAAHKAAALLQCVVVLKGSDTHIVAPDGSASIYTEGKIGLATSGSGDTLAGIIAGLLACGAQPVQAAQWGVYLHGEAGNRLTYSRGPLGFLASELLAEIPSIMASHTTTRVGG